MRTNLPTKPSHSHSSIGVPRIGSLGLGYIRVSHKMLELYSYLCICRSCSSSMFEIDFDHQPLRRVDGMLTQTAQTLSLAYHRFEDMEETRRCFPPDYAFMLCQPNRISLFDHFIQTDPNRGDSAWESSIWMQSDHASWFWIFLEHVGTDSIPQWLEITQTSKPGTCTIPSGELT